jgi:hypothetical protein
MSRWTTQQVLDAAPDQSSVKAARSLARPGPWSGTGATDGLLWGKCQGSGRTPYQVSIDLKAPAYRCSCPSRKFPCKHALALLLLWAGGGDVAEVSEPSDFASEWMESRSARAETAATKVAAHADPAARAKRVEERVATMSAGIEEFALWLTDLVRGGTAAARGRDHAYWDEAAARLVDSQCPALAADVRATASLVHRGDDWNEQLLRVIGHWWLVVTAWRRRDILPEAHRDDVRSALGWAYPTDDVRAGTTVTDRWLVLGSHRTDTGRLLEQRTWFHGLDTGERVVVLDFAAGGQPLPVAQLTGAVVRATLALYPGSAPRRALVVGDPERVSAGGPTPVAAGGPTPGEGDVATALRAVAAARAESPLVRRVPLVLESVSLGVDHLVDATGAALPLVAGRDPWPVLAATGGRPTTCFGEWDAAGFRPLSVVVDDGWVTCG